MFKSEEEIVISRRIEILNETFYGKVYAKFSICEKSLLILKIYMNVEIQFNLNVQFWEFRGADFE